MESGVPLVRSPEVGSLGSLRLGGPEVESLLYMLYMLYMLA